MRMEIIRKNVGSLVETCVRWMRQAKTGETVTSGRRVIAGREQPLAAKIVTKQSVSWTTSLF